MANLNPEPAVFQCGIRVRGRNILVPALNVCGRTIIRTGGWLKMATLRDEELVEGDPVAAPAMFAERLRIGGLGADIFTFLQRPDDSQPKHTLYWEEENLAVIPTSSFKEWWDNRIPQETRKNVRRAAKRGVVVREAPFDDELVRGIKAIYDETPVRQGRTFWHYGKDFPAVKEENGTYLERSWFVGAYCQDELIGFIKVIMVGKFATLIQILALAAHQDKRPMNALLAYTVELCEKRGATHLVYGKYRYGKKEGDSLGEFKRRNGFEELKFPRYYVPLTLKGRLALKLGVHLGLANLIPQPLARFLLSFRAWGLGLRSKPQASTQMNSETAEAN
jgi:hypothetical protein